MDLEEIKLYLRIDDDDENELLQGLQVAAEEYLYNAGVMKDYTKELYKLAIKMLVTHWYENREILGKNYKLGYSLSTIILQLKNLQRVDLI